MSLTSAEPSSCQTMWRSGRADQHPARAAVGVEVEVAVAFLERDAADAADARLGVARVHLARDQLALRDRERGGIGDGDQLFAAFIEH